MLRDQYSIGFGRERANEIYTGAMSRMYGLVALGIITTGAGIWVGDRIGLGDVILNIGWLGFLVGFGLIFGTLMAANGLAVKGRTGPATAVYLLPSRPWKGCSSPGSCPDIRPRPSALRSC